MKAAPEIKRRDRKKGKEDRSVRLADESDLFFFKVFFRQIFIDVVIGVERSDIGPIRIVDVGVTSSLQAR